MLKVNLQVHVNGNLEMETNTSIYNVYDQTKTWIEYYPNAVITIRKQ